MPRLARLLRLLIPALSLAGIGCSEPVIGYFPIEPGLRWEYAITSAGPDGQRRSERLIVKNVDIIGRDGERYLVREQADGGRNYYRLQEDGIVLLTEPPETADEEQIYLGLPAQPGRFWSSTTRLLLIDPSGSGGRTADPARTALDMTYRIKSTQSRVETPAGIYENCLEVTGTGEMPIGGHRDGTATVEVEETRWYAPGVGLVKRERHEYTRPREIRGRLTQTLVEFGVR